MIVFFKGIYEEINLEEKLSIKDSKLKIPNDFLPSSYNEEDFEEDFETETLKLPKKEDSPKAKLRDFVPNLSTIPSLSKNNKMIYNSNLEPLSERSYSFSENFNDPINLNSNENMKNKTHSSNEINTLSMPLETKMPVSKSNFPSIESELQDRPLKPSVRNSLSFQYGGDLTRQRGSTTLSDISSMPNQYKKTAFDQSTVKF